MKTVAICIEGGLLQYIAKDFEDDLRILLVDRDVDGSCDKVKGYTENFFSGAAFIADATQHLELDEAYIYEAEKCLKERED